MFTSVITLLNKNLQVASLCDKQRLSDCFRRAEHGGNTGKTPVFNTFCAISYIRLQHLKSANCKHYLYLSLVKTLADTRKSYTKRNLLSWKTTRV